MPTEPHKFLQFPLGHFRNPEYDNGRCWQVAPHKTYCGLPPDHRVHQVETESRDIVTEAQELNPAQKINLLTSLEHQAHRNHEYHPDACSECAMTQRIIDVIRKELKLTP